MVNVYMNMRGTEEVERLTKAMIYSFERTSDQFLMNLLKHKVGGLKWSVAKEPMCGHYPWILAKISYPAHMSDLTRTASGGLQAAQCLTLEEVAKQMAAETIDQCLLPIETAVEQFPRMIYQMNCIKSKKWHAFAQKVRNKGNARILGCLILPKSSG